MNRKKKPYPVFSVFFAMIPLVIFLAGCPQGDFFPDIDDSEPPVSVSGVSLDRETAGLFVNASVTLQATVSPSDATNNAVTWSSGDTNVATVSSAGVVTGVHAGTATVTVTTADGGFTDSCPITVSDPASGGDEFTEASDVFTQNYDFGSVSGNNRGVGQLLVYNYPYIPVSFSVFIDDQSPIEGVTSGISQSGTMQLYIRDMDDGTVYGTD